VSANVDTLTGLRFTERRRWVLLASGILGGFCRFARYGLRSVREREHPRPGAVERRPRFGLGLGRLEARVRETEASRRPGGDTKLAGR
jgi:hypothetical protein